MSAVLRVPAPRSVESMRILVVTSEWFPDWKGGNARVATATARGLAERGHAVTVLAPQVPGAAGVLGDGSLTIARELPHGRLPVTLTHFTTARSFGRRRRREFDVVMTHAEASTCGILAAGVEAPLVFVYHGVGAVRELSYDRARFGPGPKRLAQRALEPLLRRFERDAVAGADLALVLSDYSRSMLAGDHPASRPRIRSVRGGVDVDAFTPLDGPEAARARLGLEDSGPVLLTVRRLEPRMGIENLIRAFHALAIPDGRLYIVGGGSLEGSLRALTRELGLDRRVRFVGQIGDDELADWYRAADLFVLPTAAYEGFGMVTVEALASGTPVVGTPAGATPEILRPLDPRLVTRGTDPAALAEAIDAALELSGGEFRRRCRAYTCERYAWERVLDDWEDALVEAQHAWGERSARRAA